MRILLSTWLWLILLLASFVPREASGSDADASDPANVEGSPVVGISEAALAAKGETGFARLERTAPAHPEQNGRHERMHRTLKAETARPPAANGSSQQERFNQFRREYNEQRPHEALRQRTPSELYQPAVRPYPKRCISAVTA